MVTDKDGQIMTAESFLSAVLPAPAPSTFAAPSTPPPVPQFFSPYPNLALRHLQLNPDATNDIISNVNSRFLHMEHLSPEEAANYLKAKRGRTAKGVVAFPPPAVSRKRARPQSADISESGIDHTILKFAHFPPCIKYPDRMYKGYTCH
jgi:hypothetical protein